MIPSAPPVFSEDTGPSPEAFQLEKPVEFFHFLFTDELLDVVLSNTNLYATQQGADYVFTREDVFGYIGLNIAMGIANLPYIQDYWTRTPMLQIPWFSSVFVNRGT